ncbi:MAG: HAD family hydrolase [Sinimarinibacterium flocculans]|uniref:Phosphoglycolate phosphatase n=1 Tax=Sinimarinibacterium flocculans TaxID=985250 RepID=A0A318E4Q7_9GAMM|nr:HAD-IA family hydrolase [Sinimarinibacterium flocculans]PXV66181.1 phosphoglycolate phosphatase [Sinimarinibacterium flocculans]
MKYELLIFDWDGTLADSAGQIVSAMQGAIDGLGLPPRSDESIRELIGLGLNDALARLYPELELSGLRALLDGYRAKWLSEGAGEARLFDGAFEAVADLHRQGCRIVIATGKSRRGLDRSLRHHQRLAELVANSRCADETASKPDPLMLRELLADEGVAVERALMIGDTEYDIAMAQSIGMHGLGVACGVHDPGRLQRAGAAAVIESVAGLPVWLQGRV